MQRVHAIFLILIITLIFWRFLAAPVFAQEVVIDTTVLLKARVIAVSESPQKALPGVSISSETQMISVELLEGERKGTTVSIFNDYLPFSEGDLLYVLHTTNPIDGIDTYAVSEPYRLPALLLFFVLFILVVFAVGGKQGIRGLAALAGGLALIGSFLLPGIIAGYSPVLVSVIVASLISILGSYVTHGFNKTTSSAVLGMVATILFTGALAFLAVHLTRLTGLYSEDAVYLNFDTKGTIDLQGLLLGSIIIGLLGGLYDAAIGQAAAVDELRSVAPHLPRTVIYRRAVRIGREHIGALVNTLAIAYVGAALPLILLFYNSASGSTLSHLNQEVFATEIIRTLVGSIGLVLAVPLTTVIAVWMLFPKKEEASAEVLKQEEKLLSRIGHTHSHT
ncbi:MAG: YibE/F family protein [Candidatus Pacebacteria bacterium]|jgi:uncharacterized membrane protein|nr:YibE/F family protein [Candidatus Paceibacterota bacterium]